MSFGASLKMSELRYCCIVADDAGKIVRESRGNCPLQTVSVTGLIRDAVAQYTLVQSYVNPLEDAAIEAVYTFPLYEGVAVCGFEAEVDGRKIVGRVQEKVAAKKEYEAAKKAGKVASLLEEDTPDTFQASVGNIPPSKTVAIRITLVSDIKQDAGENQVRFVMPTSIAPRYGYTPVEQSSSSIAASSTALSVNIGCAMSKAITSIQSPSHTIEVHLGTTSSDASFSFQPNRAKVSLTADSLLDRDLVIIVQALGLDEPRAMVERHPNGGTHAISLTFTPRFALNPIRSLELIFIVDRSGSMIGTPIRKAGAALELFLRSIPVEDYYFNVIGFGSSHQALFPKSVAYSAESLKKGALYAQRMQADLGGTEMRSAFEEAFKQRRRDVPTQIFLLTDGDIWGVESLCEIIREAVDEGEKKSSSVRVFSLGIGNSVSHNLIESVARAGGGYAQLVVESERMEKKVLNMLKSALVPPASNLGVQWTSEAMAPVNEAEEFVLVEAEECSRGEEDSAPAPAPAPPVVAPDEGDATNKTPINLFSTSPEVPSPPPPALPPPDVVVPIYQAPFKIPILCRGARFTVYALLSSTIPVPEELVLQGSSPDGPLELKVKTEKVQDGETMLHSLAARAIVRDLEEGASCIHALGITPTATPTQKEMLKTLGVHVVDSEGKKYTNAELSAKHVTEITKRQILDIAMRYNLSSKYTSWVAIDEDSHQSILHDKFEAGSQRFSSRSSAFGAPMKAQMTATSYSFGNFFAMGHMAAPSYGGFGGGGFGSAPMAAPWTGCFGSGGGFGSAPMAAPSNSAFGSAPMGAPSNIAFGCYPMGAPSNVAFGCTSMAAPSNSAFGSAPMGAPSNVAFGRASMGAPSNVAFGSDPMGAPSNVAFGCTSMAAPSNNAFGSAPMGAPSNVAFGCTSMAAPSNSAFGSAPMGAPSNVAFGRASMGAPSNVAFGSDPMGAPSNIAFGCYPMGAPSNVAFGCTSMAAPSNNAFGSAPMGAPSNVAFGRASMGAPSNVTFGSDPMGAPSNVAFGCTSMAAPSNNAFGSAPMGAPSNVAFGCTSMAAPSNNAFGSAPMGAPSNVAFGRASMGAPSNSAFGSAPMGAPSNGVCAQMAAPSNGAFCSAPMGAPSNGAFGSAPMAAPSNFAFGSVAKMAPMAASMAAPMPCQDVETFESPTAECLDTAFDGAGSEDEEFSAVEEKCDSYTTSSTPSVPAFHSLHFVSGPAFHSSHFGSGAQHQFEGDQCEEPITATDPHSRLRSILQHQSFDGSFPLVPEIAAFFSTTVEDLNGKLAEVRKQCALSTLSESEWGTIWATWLAVEFMKKQLPELQAEWELVVEKAEKRVEPLLRNAQDVAAVKEAAAVVATAAGRSASSTTVALGDVVDTRSAPEVAVLSSLIGPAEPEITPPSPAAVTRTGGQCAEDVLETEEAAESCTSTTTTPKSDVVKLCTAPE